MSLTRFRPAQCGESVTSSLTDMDQQDFEASEPTGIAAVDEVVRQVSDVTNQPVADHVQVFERAHEQLRRALDALPEADSEHGQDA